LKDLQHQLSETTTSSLTVPHPSLYGVPSSAPLLPLLTSGPDLGAWPDCWVSVEFLHAPIPQMGSGSTIIYDQLAHTTKRSSFTYALHWSKKL